MTGRWTRTDFARQVRDALAHLYDPVFLQTHPLTRLLPGEADQRGHPQAGNALRQHLRDAIALLHPPGKAPEGSRAWRRHRLLHLRYEEGLPPPAVQADLGISKAEYYREHDQALAAVASLLAERWAGDGGAAPGGPFGRPSGESAPSAAAASA